MKFPFHFLFSILTVFFVQKSFCQNLKTTDNCKLYTISEQEATNAARGWKVKSGSGTQAGNSYDLKYEQLHFTVDPHRQFIAGKINFYFTPTVANFSNMILDCSDSLHIDSVFYHQSICLFHHQNKDAVSIDFFNLLPKNQLDSVTVFYHGVPEFGIGFKSFVSDTINGSAVLWTLSEPYGAKDWMPCKQSLNDKIDSLDTYITCPDSFRTASNGLMINSSINNNWKTEHWKHRYPIATYLIAIACARYNEFYNYVPLGNDTLKIQNLVYPASDSEARVVCKRFENVMKFYESKFGPYPFRKEKYGHAQFGWGGGMEHQTHTFVSHFSDGLLAHELAHQWFGDKITCGSWEDIWLNEGFATYCASMADQFVLNPENFNVWRFGTKDELTKKEAGSVKCDDTTKVYRIFSGLYSYSKGAWVLHMLRYQVGDSLFFKSMRSYINDTFITYKYATTAKLRKHFEKVCNRSFKDYFELWYHQKEIPVQKVYWWQESDGVITIRLIQKTMNDTIPFYQMPLQFKMKSWANGIYVDSLITILPTSNDQLFSFHSNIKVMEIEADYNANVLEKFQLFQSPLTKIELTSQLNITPNPASDKVFINAENHHLNYILVYGADGRLLSNSNLLAQTKSLKSVEGLLQIDISNLPNGLLIFEMTEEGGQKYYGRIIKCD